MAEYSLPNAAPGTTERHLIIHNATGEHHKTHKLKPSTTNMTVGLKEGWKFTLIDQPNPKPVVEFHVPRGMPEHFDVGAKCQSAPIIDNPPTPPSGKQPEPSLVQDVQEPVALQQSVGVQVVRAAEPEDIMKLPPAERIALGYKPTMVDGKVQWTKA